MAKITASIRASAYSVLSGKEGNGIPFAQGVGITALLAIAAKQFAGYPVLGIMGQLVLAMLLGMVWRAVGSVPQQSRAGIAFSSKTLLRAGIILLGMRLNLLDIVRVGPKVIALALVNILFALATVYAISKLIKLDKRLGLLTACGTAICGAAAVAAISPQIGAKEEETAISAATVAILGTIFTLLYTLLYPFLGLTAQGYGIFAGATLHEVAHVVAAAVPGGQTAMDAAVIVKLTRVAFLAPIAVVLGIWMKRKDVGNTARSAKGRWQSVPIPWFVLGFLAMSGINTLGIIPESLTNGLVAVAYLLIAMAMAALGLQVDWSAFRRFGMKAFAAGLIGSVLLSALGWLLVRWIGLSGM